MPPNLWTVVDGYICDLLVAAEPALDAALAASAAAGLPAISVTPNHGKLLALLVQLCSARAILEIGTLGGYSDPDHLGLMKDAPWATSSIDSSSG